MSCTGLLADAKTTASQLGQACPYSTNANARETHRAEPSSQCQPHGRSRAGFLLIVSLSSQTLPRAALGHRACWYKPSGSIHEHKAGRGWFPRCPRLLSQNLREFVAVCIVLSLWSTVPTPHVTSLEYVCHKGAEELLNLEASLSLDKGGELGEKPRHLQTEDSTIVLPAKSSLMPQWWVLTAGPGVQYLGMGAGYSF